MSSTTELTPTQREFRAAMSNLSAGVNVVTTDGPLGRAGITVSAVCSVTDSPPTMLVCINRSSRNHDVFCGNKRIGINVLGRQHEEMALLFAGATGVQGEERFRDSAWDHDVADVPLLRGSAASVAGTVASVARHGSHSVLFVEVDRVLLNDRSGGLVYFQRQFHPLVTPPMAF